MRFYGHVILEKGSNGVFAPSQASNYLCGMLGYIKAISANIITVRLTSGKIVKVKKGYGVGK
jgi:hypothetical protein